MPERCINRFFKESSPQWLMTYNILAPPIPPMNIQSMRFEMSSAFRPMRKPRRPAVHIPIMKPVASIMPYQWTVMPLRSNATGVTSAR